MDDGGAGGGQSGRQSDKARTHAGQARRQQLRHMREDAARCSRAQHEQACGNAWENHARMERHRESQFLLIVLQRPDEFAHAYECSARDGRGRVDDHVADRAPGILHKLQA